MIQKISITLPEQLINESKEYAEKNGATFSGLCRIGLQKVIFHERE